MNPLLDTTVPISLSYQGQDLFVLDVLGGKRNGFFVDSGASDGLRGSNTKLLESEFGWQGICVEPNATLYARLTAHRRCICLNCCLYDRDGDVEFLEGADVYGGIVDEYDPVHLRYVTEVVAGSSSSVESLQPRRKPARTLRSILDEANAPRLIDYWSLDTEGSELTILKSFPFDDYRFRVLTVEHNNLPARDEIRCLLEARGYRRVGSLGIDDCYVWSGEPLGQAWRSRVWSRPGRVG